MATTAEAVLEAATQHWQLLAAAAVGVYCVYRIVRFIKADGDMTIMAARAPPPSAFLGKKVWITGASQGLGAELAKQFAAQGAILILSARNRERLEEIKSQLRGTYAPGNVTILPLDLTGPYAELEAAAKAADAVPGPHGSAGVQILVHNAGASQHALIEETSAGVSDKMLALNTAGPILLTRAALPYLLARPPARIVVVSSMAALVPSPGQSMYSACKQALTGYFLSAAAELSQRGVSVTVCYPGPIATGEPGAPRSVYGPEGLVVEHGAESGKKSRMAPQRVAELIVRATYHSLDTAWISKHPVLLMAYLMQYLPTLGLAVMKLIGPGRAASLKGGSGGYDIKSMLFSKKAE